MYSIFPQPLEGFPINFKKMFIPVRKFAKHIAQPCRLKVKLAVEGNVIDVMSGPYLILVEYLSKLDDVQSV